MKLGDSLAEFELPDALGNVTRSSDFKGSKALLVMFICNHCPYVVHIADALAKLGKAYPIQDLAIIAINSNDYSNYPTDAPQYMLRETEMRG